MRILVDAVPTEPDDCLLMEYAEFVSDEVLDNADTCEDCGGVILDEDDVDLVCWCPFGGRCALDIGEECEFLADGYVTRF